jgi:hypothetical protein
MPDAGRIVCTYCVDGKEPELSTHDLNHNIFRLDKKGDVMWQIRRAEGGRLNLAAMKLTARTHCETTGIEPFMNLLVIRADGSRSASDPDGAPSKLDQWESGCRIHSNSLSGIDYDIDVDTGIARNLGPSRHRPW